MARLPVEQAEKGQRQRSSPENTFSAYSQSIRPGRDGAAHGSRRWYNDASDSRADRVRVPARSSVRRVRGSGVDLAVTELGDRGRPTVLLVHGFPDTSAVWAPVAQLLATSGFHVVAYDVRGAGDSGVPSHAVGLCAGRADRRHGCGHHRGQPGLASSSRRSRLGLHPGLGGGHQRAPRRPHRELHLHFGSATRARRPVGSEAPHPTALRPSPRPAPSCAFVVHRGSFISRCSLSSSRPACESGAAASAAGRRWGRSSR